MTRIPDIALQFEIQHSKFSIWYARFRDSV